MAYLHDTVVLLCVARRTALRQMSMRRLASLQNVSPHLHYKKGKKEKTTTQVVHYSVRYNIAWLSYFLGTKTGNLVLSLSLSHLLLL